MGLPQAQAEPEAGADADRGAVLQLYGEKYFDFNVQHFHEKLREVHGIQLSYRDRDTMHIASQELPQTRKPLRERSSSRLVVEHYYRD